jgi:hypothetical protein
MIFVNNTFTLSFRPKWTATEARWLAVQRSVSHMKTPKEWPRPNNAFSNVGSLKTSELLLLAGNSSTFHTKLG